MRHLIPIWIGIVLNLLFAVVNLSLVGHHGKVATAYMKYAPWGLGAAWIALLAWAFAGLV